MTIGELIKRLKKEDAGAPVKVQDIDDNGNFCDNPKVGISRDLQDGKVTRYCKTKPARRW
jgi:hypothetical protein